MTEEIKAASSWDPASIAALVAALTPLIVALMQMFMQAQQTQTKEK
jgi:hypothetical protein